MLIIAPGQEALKGYIFDFLIMCPHKIYHFYSKKKITSDYSESAAMGFFLGTQERVRNSHGKQAISV